MLNNIYKAIKGQLKTPANSINNNPRTGIDLPTEWFNMQYDGIMTHENGFFVEFPDKLNFEHTSKQQRQAPVAIRLHYYSKVVQTHDGIADEVIEAHEQIALSAQNLLDGFTPANKSCKKLVFNGWRHWHRWKGWMVTYIEFEAKKDL